ncbi:hypothetical protein [Herbidospora galbida]|nr:hypothetical protein [Herbidospora galbida]
MMIVLIVIGALLHGTPAAHADWAHDKCSYAELSEEVVTTTTARLATDNPFYRVSVGKHDGPDSITYDKTVQVTATSEFSGGGSAGVDLAKIISIAGEAGYKYGETLSDSFRFAKTVTTVAGEFRYVAPVVQYDIVALMQSWTTPGGYTCLTAITSALFPKAVQLCDWLVTDFVENCRLPRGSRGGGGNPGTVTPPDSGPQPVTDVNGLADGTLLHTTDTQRIYKMVGGSPVWQATCADGICATPSRPTTQSVVNAGPATPRNGSSAVDQRGNVYLFVGGAPLWQHSCAAPVTCGSPVKISNWSIDARDHMNARPADGNLVQAKAGNLDLPVAMTVGGALVTFANPQELADVGQGGNWQQRVVAISANSYHELGFKPADGTLVQGAGGAATPVAMLVGGAVVPFESPQEVIDVGQGADWASRVRAIPVRAFNAWSRVPADMTLIQGTGGGTSSPVAQIVGGARINIATPQELLDTGYGPGWASLVRAVPLRAFNAMRADVPADGTLVQGIGTPVAAIVGGGRTDFGTPAEVEEAGYGASWRALVRAVPARAFAAMSQRIGDGTRLRRADGASQGGVYGGALVPFHSMAELIESGYEPRPLQAVPARVWDALPRTIGDGIRIKDAHSTGQATIVGGAKVAFHSMAELTEAGYADTPMHVVPGRVWDALPTTIGDGVRIKDASSASQAAIVGGAKIPFVSQAELEESGYADDPMRVIPRRVWDALPTRIADGVRIKDASSASQAAIVGGAKIPFVSQAELEESGYADDPMRVIPRRVWDALPTTIADGTFIKSPTSAAVWLIQNGRRVAAAQPGTVRVVPARVVDAIPPA